MSDIEKLKRKVFLTGTCRRFGVRVDALEALCGDLCYESEEESVLEEEYVMEESWYPSLCGK